MKNLKRHLGILLVFAMLVGMLVPSSTVMAASKKISATLTPTKSNQKQKYSKRDVWYKMDITGEGYVTITLPAKNTDSISIYDAAREEYTSIEGDWNKTVSYKYAVSKGSIYIYVRSYWESSNNLHYFNYKFTSINQTNNSRKGAAYSLSKNKEVSFYQTPDYTFRRWYKLSVTKGQRLTVYVKSNNYLDDKPKLYNSKGKEITLNYYDKDSNGFTVYKTPENYTVPKGTYYLTFNTYYNNDFGNHGTIVSLKWK